MGKPFHCQICGAKYPDGWDFSQTTDIAALKAIQVTQDSPQGDTRAAVSRDSGSDRHTGQAADQPGETSALPSAISKDHEPEGDCSGGCSHVAQTGYQLCDCRGRHENCLVIGRLGDEVVALKAALAEASLEAENLQLRSALDAMMAAHWNLYLCQFPNGDPNDDLVRVKARAALTRPAIQAEDK